MAVIIENDSVNLPEQGSAPATPDTGRQKLYFGTDGYLYAVDDAGSAVRVQPTSDQATALAAYQAALAAAEAAQVLTATGPGEAAFAAPAGGGASLSDYSNVIVVDAGGNGDYETLGAAIANAPDGSVIFVFGHTTETEDIFIDGATYPAVNLTIVVTPNAVVDLGSFSYFLFAPGVQHAFTGGGTITSGSNTTIGVFDGTLLNVNIEIKNTAASGAALDMQNSGSAVVKSRHTAYTATGGTGAAIKKNSSAMGAGTYFVHDRMIGRVISAISWANAPFYLCTFNGTVSNVTAASGTANGTNVVF